MKDHILLTILQIFFAPRVTEPVCRYTLYLAEDHGHNFGQDIKITVSITLEVRTSKMPMIISAQCKNELVG